MTNLVVTAAQVALVSGAPISDAVAGEAFITGNVVYLRGSDRRWLKAQCDGTIDEAGANGLAIALGTAEAVGAHISVASDGCIVDLGAAAAAPAATPFMPAAIAGQIAPIADAATTNRVTLLALGVGSGRVLVQRVYNAGSVKP